MSLCKVCLRDGKEHSEKLWNIHQKNQSCEFCLRDGKEHSEKLWNIHQATIQKALEKTKHKKLYRIQPGYGPECPAILDNDFEWATIVNSKDGMMETSIPSRLNPAEWLCPVYISCLECGLYLGSVEENSIEVLDGLCLKCFNSQRRESHDQ
mgnify:CR=1 FL=1